ncbi:response regulator [Paenibacillus sp. TRM 82003]|nr:response regulator [Paenibacillus sp. TRM 82003]
MIKVLLVDDEWLARSYVKGLLDWEKHGFIICGEAGNGFEAIEAVERHSPEVVIADVHMAGMDGVALCRALEERENTPKVIMLSSFDNYEYVRDTLRSGAVDYLLKHRVDASSLLDLLGKVKGELERERKRKQGDDYLTENWNELQMELSHSYAKALVLGPEEERRKAEAYFAKLSPIGTQNMQLGVMEIVNFLLLTEHYTEEQTNKFVRSIVDVCRQGFQETNGFVVDLERGKLLLWFSYGEQRSESAMQQQYRLCLQRIEQALRSYLNLRVSFGTGPVVHGVSGIPAAYASCCRSLAERRALQLGGGIAGEAVDDAFTLSLQQERDLLAAIEQADAEKVSFLLEKLFAAMMERRATSRSIQMTVSELINLSEKVWRKSGEPAGHFYEGAFLSRAELGSVERLDEIRAWTDQWFATLLRKLPKEAAEGSSSYVRAAKTFVRRRFRDNVSLEQAAEHVGITASYLSRLFKQEIGVNFTDYLNQVRIEYAKQLIQDGNGKMKEIYGDVGFASYNYFFKVFKQIVGTTPNAYAKRTERRP